VIFNLIKIDKTSYS